MTVFFDDETAAEIARTAAEARAGNAPFHARAIEAGVTIAILTYLSGESLNKSRPDETVAALGDIIGQALHFWLKEWPVEARTMIASIFAKVAIEQTCGVPCVIGNGVNHLSALDKLRPN